VVFTAPGYNIDSLIPSAYNYASVPVVDFPIAFGGERPTVDVESEAGGPPEAPDFDIAAIQEISVPADDLLAPTSVFEFAEQAYTSILLDPLKAKLLNDLLNGGTGIEAADEAALLQRTREREVEIGMLGVQGAGGFMASRGFALPPETRALYEAHAQQRAQNMMSTLERDIRVDQNDRRLQNRRFTIEQVRQVEQVATGFFNSIQERSLNAAKASHELGLALYSALVQRFRARLERAKLRGDLQEAQFRSEVLRVQAFLERYRGQIAGYEANLRRLTEAAQSRVSLYKADIESNRGLTQGLIAKEQLQQKVLESVTTQNIDISRLTLENARAKLTAVVQALQFQVEAKRFGASNFFAQLTAMLGSLNSLTVTSTEE
jgi:hypothetical protein